MMPENCTPAMIREKARSMGTMYALDGVYTLAELGLERFPMTVTGKVQKAKLKDIVMQYRARSVELSPPPTPDSTRIGPTLLTEKPYEPLTEAIIEPRAPGPDMRELLFSLWEDLVGFRPKADDRIQTFADSITVLRYCERVLNSLGQRLYLQDFAENPTVGELAALLVSRTGSDTMSFQAPVAPRANFSQLKRLGAPPPLSESPMVKSPVLVLSTTPPMTPTKPGHVSRRSGSGPAPVQDFQLVPGVYPAAVQALADIGLSADDLEDVLPINDYFRQMIPGPRPQSWRHRVTFYLDSTLYSFSRVRQAIELGLASRPILRSVLATLPDGTVFHALAKSSAGLYSQIISEATAETAEEADDLKTDDSAGCFPATVMTQARMIVCPTTSRLHLTLTYSHSVFDVLSINLFHADLDRILAAEDASRVSIPSLTPFRLFADLLYGYSASGSALASVAHNVRRLRGISQFPAALWPPQRAPGWFMASDAESPWAAERAAIRDAAWEASGIPYEPREFRTPRASRVVNLPGMEAVRVGRGVDPQTVTRAALAVFNALQTGQPFAVFNSIYAARSWPFVPAWMSGMLPPAMSVDGPTLSWVLNMFRVDLLPARHPGQRAESVGELVTRMQAEEQEQEKHAHAPWGRILDELGPDEAAVAMDASYRQTFVWDISMRLMGQKSGDYQALMIDGRQDWADW
jgi:hypothetical protein